MPARRPSPVPLAVLLALCLPTTPAAAESLVVSLSVSRLAVTASYTGTSVALFGAVERDAQTVSRAGRYEVVVTVRGPRQTLTVREKEQLGPVWLNREQRKFADVPAFLAVLSSAPLPEIAAEADRRRLGLGLETVVDRLEGGRRRRRGGEPFREALLRLKRQDGLFLERPDAVNLLTPTIFRTVLPLPATAPIGHYDVEVVLLSGGAALARQQVGFDLVKAGVEARLASFARDWSGPYGIAVAAMALAAGWLASVIFRRD